MKTYHYPAVIEDSASGNRYFAIIPDFIGFTDTCVFADSIHELRMKAQEVVESAVKTMIQNGQDLPDDSEHADYFNTRAFVCYDIVITLD